MSELPRTLDLFIDLQQRTLVQGPNSNAPVTALDFYQGDTCSLVLHGLMPVTDTSLTLYQEAPLIYPTIYAGLYA